MGGYRQRDNVVGWENIKIWNWKISHSEIKKNQKDNNENKNKITKKKKKNAEKEKMENRIMALVNTVVSWKKKNKK